MQKKKQIKKIKKKHVFEFENNSFLTELYGNHDQNLAKFEKFREREKDIERAKSGQHTSIN